MLFTQDEGEIINLNFDTKDIASFIGCAGIGVWYILKKVSSEYSVLLSYDLN